MSKSHSFLHSSVSSPAVGGLAALAKTDLSQKQQHQQQQYIEEELVPMENFSLVCKGVYRSSFPKKKNFAFLKKLGLKSVLWVFLVSIYF